MTRARALKHIIRARAAKTGERYTAARRHVLAGLAIEGPPVPKPAPLSNAERPAPRTTKDAVSERRVRELTGHGLDHWFEVLDRFGAVEKGHTAAARHLAEEHTIPGWYAQGITVSYERARGVRAVNQRCDGEYEVSISKVLTAGTNDIVRALSEDALRRRWTKSVDPQLARALAESLDSPSSKGIVVRADGQGRYRYKWDDTVVQLYLYPKPGGKVSVVVTNSKLPNSSMVEARRAQWRDALAALGEVVRPPKTATRGR
jgi:hypothetical protein